MKIFYNAEQVYNNIGWIKEKNQVIIFNEEQQVDPDFYQWLKENGSNLTLKYDLTNINFSIGKHILYIKSKPKDENLQELKSNEVIYIVYGILQPPTILIAGDSLFFNVNKLAIGYEIYYNNRLLATLTQKRQNDVYLIYYNNELIYTTTKQIQIPMSLFNLPPGLSKITVKALGDINKYYINSDYSNPQKYSKGNKKLQTPIVTLKNGVVSWNIVDYGRNYSVYINDRVVPGLININKTFFNVNDYFSDAGKYYIQVQALGYGFYSDSDLSSRVLYEITVAPTIFINEDFSNEPSNILWWGHLNNATDYDLWINDKFVTVVKVIDEDEESILLNGDMNPLEYEMFEIPKGDGYNNINHEDGIVIEDEECLTFTRNRIDESI